MWGCDSNVCRQIKCCKPIYFEWVPIPASQTIVFFQICQVQNRHMWVYCTYAYCWEIFVILKAVQVIYTFIYCNMWKLYTSMLSANKLWFPSDSTTECIAKSLIFFRLVRYWYFPELSSRLLCKRRSFALQLIFISRVRTSKVFLSNNWLKVAN